MEQSKARKVEAWHVDAAWAIASAFSPEISAYGIAQIIADHAPAETTKDATSGQGEQDGQGVEIVAGMDSGGAVGHLDNTAVHPLRPDSDSRQAQVGGAVEQAGAAPDAIQDAEEWLKRPENYVGQEIAHRDPTLCGPNIVDPQCELCRMAIMLAAYAQHIAESELSALRRENAELQQSLKDEESASLDAFLKIEKLQSALGRTLANFERILAQKPVRDASETIGEARAALAEPRPASSQQ